MIRLNWKKLMAAVAAVSMFAASLSADCLPALAEEVVTDESAAYAGSGQPGGELPAGTLDIKNEAVDQKAESDDPATASLDFILEDAGGESSEVTDEAGLDTCFTQADSNENVLNTFCPDADSYEAAVADSDSVNAAPEETADGEREETVGTAGLEEITDLRLDASEYVITDMDWGDEEKSYQVNYKWSEVTETSGFTASLYVYPSNFADYGLKKVDLYNNYLVATSSDPSVVEVLGVVNEDYTRPNWEWETPDYCMVFWGKYKGPGTATINVRTKDGSCSINMSVNVIDDTKTTDATSAVFALNQKTTGEDKITNQKEFDEGHVIGIQVKPSDAAFTVEGENSDPSVMTLDMNPAISADDKAQLDKKYPNTQWVKVKPLKAGVSLLTFTVRSGSKTFKLTCKFTVAWPKSTGVAAKKVGWAFENWNKNSIISYTTDDPYYVNGEYDGIIYSPLNAEMNITYTNSNPAVVGVREKPRSNFRPEDVHLYDENPNVKWYNFDFYGVGDSTITFLISSGNKTWTVTRTFHLINHVDFPMSAEVAKIVKGQKLDLWDVVPAAGASTGILASDRDDKTFAFKPDNSKLASINGKGLLTAKSPGTVEIRYKRIAYYHNAEGKLKKKTITGGTGAGILIVTPTVTQKKVTLNRLGQTANSQEIINCIVPATRYTSSKPGVAMVNSTTGEVTATGKGSAKITAEFGEGKNAAKYSYTVNVNAPCLSKRQLTLKAGAKKGTKITLKGIPKESAPAIKWGCGDDGTVSITPNPKNNASCMIIPGASAGNATVTAELDGVAYTCAVTVVSK
ncbi:MAG: hypothetical protein K6G27_15150 [Lachnospiraceae bacterium]|nr:hypothetical protein [Lachnospiraceae bacterium]